MNKISIFSAIYLQFVKLILRLEFQDEKIYTKLLLFSSPAFLTNCQNVAKDIFCKDQLKVKLWAQLNPKIDLAVIKEPSLALLWFAKYADYQMHVLELF